MFEPEKNSKETPPVSEGQLKAEIKEICNTLMSTRLPTGQSFGISGEEAPESIFARIFDDKEALPTFLFMAERFRTYAIDSSRQDLKTLVEQLEDPGKQELVIKHMREKLAMYKVIASLCYQLPIKVGFYKAGYQKMPYVLDKKEIQEKTSIESLKHSSIFPTSPKSKESKKATTVQELAVEIRKIYMKLHELSIPRLNEAGLSERVVLLGNANPEMILDIIFRTKDMMSKYLMQTHKIYNAISPPNLKKDLMHMIDNLDGNVLGYMEERLNLLEVIPPLLLQLDSAVDAYERALANETQAVQGISPTVS